MASVQPRMSSAVRASLADTHQRFRHRRSKAAWGKYFSWSRSAATSIQLATASGNSEKCHLGSRSAVLRSRSANVSAKPAFISARHDRAPSLRGGGIHGRPQLLAFRGPVRNLVENEKVGVLPSVGASDVAGREVEDGLGSLVLDAVAANRQERTEPGVVSA